MSVTDEVVGGESEVSEGELGAVRAAAQACVEAQAGGESEEGARARVTAAAKAALDAGHGLAAVAAAERAGQQAARERVRPQLLRAVERAAKKLREASAEHEQAIVQAARVGLPVREIAARGQVAHATVGALLRRHHASSPTAGMADVAGSLAGADGSGDPLTARDM